MAESGHAPVPVVCAGLVPLRAISGRMRFCRVFDQHLSAVCKD